MSVWQPTKTLITNKGLSMLSASQSGLGAINITRAEIGSTFSQTSALPDLLAIPFPKGNPILGEKTHDVTGTTIKVVLENGGITTPFQICQVGIYATHPSVDEGAERLYMISQSELPADTLPAESTTFVRLKYKMYLKHSSSATINVMLNESYLPTASATELGAVKIGDGLAISGEGVLSTQVINLASETVAGIIKVGDNLTVESDGTLNAKESVSIVTAPTKPALLANQYWFETLS